MRNVRRLLATAIAVIGLSFAAVPAYSAPFSYYELVSNMQGDAQTNFAKTMLRSYESGYATLKPMAEKYGHYPWAANLVETTNFYENEIARYQALLGGVATIAEITATHQTFKYNETQQVTETPEVASRSSSQDEVTEDYTVNVYEDVVITHTKIHYTMV